MTTTPPTFTSREEYRASNRRMAEDILAAEPAPYTEGGYVRRVVDIRGRRSGQVHPVPIAVITLSGRRFIVSPTRERNWVRNLLAEPGCVLRSRDDTQSCRATPVTDPERIADVVSTYLALMKAPWAVAQFPFPPDAGRARIRQAAADVAVFQLEPAAAH